MPIRPLYEWEQTVEDVLIKATLKGYRGKGKMVSIIIADFVVTVNATPYLLMLDTLHELDPEKSTYHFEDEDDAAVVHLKLRKKVVGETWDALCVSMSKAQLLERRGASLKREEERYNQKLDARAGQLKAESRRMTEEQWEVEKKQRQVIEGRVEMEKTEAEEDLYSWEEQQQQQKSKDLPATPADIARGAAAAAAASQPAAETSGVVAAADPQIRHFETTNITIDFTPKSLTLPTRSRGDEEYYRQSRYKPVSIEDSPMFWKHRADSFYKEHSWKAAVEAYSESIKRDGVFLTCVMDRAACYLHLMEYRKCIDDCTLALTMLANTPASEITQDRYRGLMTKIHARRGAAYCWSEDLKSGVQDLRMAAAYRDPNEDHDVEQDLQLIEKLMEERGIVEDERDPQQTRMQEASAHYYHNKYEEAVEMYQAILEENPYHPHGRSNLIATFLHMGRFREALEECQKLIAFCGEVADALQQRAGGDLNQADRGDSDDEDEEMLEDERVAGEGEEDNRDDLVRKHRAASRKIAENSAHVYLLLKTYVRASSALCGMHRYQEAYPYLEKAVQIAPYDNDLREDANRLIEKIRMDTLVSASSMSAQKNATPAPATVAA